MGCQDTVMAASLSQPDNLPENLQQHLYILIRNASMRFQFVDTNLLRINVLVTYLMKGAEAIAYLHILYESITVANIAQLPVRFWMHMNTVHNKNSEPGIPSSLDYAFFAGCARILSATTSRLKQAWMHKGTVYNKEAGL
eukprot:1144380-Pelagomonas_calceolata.AAC.11